MDWCPEVLIEESVQGVALERKKISFGRKAIEIMTNFSFHFIFLFSKANSHKFELLILSKISKLENRNQKNKREFKISREG